MVTIAKGVVIIAKLDKSPDFFLREVDIVTQKDLVHLFGRGLARVHQIILQELAIDILPFVAQLQGELFIEHGSALVVDLLDSD